MSDMVSLIKGFCESREDCKYHEGYSGRGMFGKQCTGICCEGSVFKQIVRLCDFLHENGVDNVEETLGAVCVDSMGMGNIIYFPEISSSG